MAIFELWLHGLQEKHTTTHSKFNRLAVMATHDDSWHSGQSDRCRRKSRCCLSNYHFSKTSLKATDRFHIRSFRGRPEQKIRDTILKADIQLRMAVRKMFKKGIVENKHVYKK